MCLSCGDEDILSGSTCESGTEMSRKCKTPIQGNRRCALCRDGFYRGDTACVACPDNCESCAKSGCRVCDADFWLNATTLLCEPFDTLAHCTAKTATGRASCETGFFVSGQMCVACSTATAGCASCCDSNGLSTPYATRAVVRESWLIYLVGINASVSTTPLPAPTPSTSRAARSRHRFRPAWGGG